MSELEIVRNKLSDEQSQLFQKLYKLDDFLVSGIATKNVSSEQINLMWMQRNAMKMYIDILQMRIDELSERICKEKEHDYKVKDLKLTVDALGLLREETEIKSKFCANCGEENSIDAKKCKNCSAEL